MDQNQQQSQLKLLIAKGKEQGYLTYAEAFQAPNMYMNHLMEKDVAPDYQEFFDTTTGKK